MAPSFRAFCSGRSCMSTAVISPAPARFSTATTSAPIGPAPMTSADLFATSPARDTACQATEAGSTRAASRRLSPLGQRPQHPAGQGRVLDEGSVGVRESAGAAQVGAAGREVRPVGRIAGEAVIGRGGRVDRDRGANARPAAVRGRLHHGPDDLVAQDHRCPQDRVAGRAVRPVMQVRAADPAVGDLDHGLVGSRLAERLPALPSGRRRRTRSRRASRWGGSYR